jgi:dolichol-phosphate mannosyltransferase
VRVKDEDDTLSQAEECVGGENPPSPLRVLIISFRFFPQLLSLLPPKQLKARVMRWRSQASALSSLPVQAGTFLITFLLSLIFLRSSSSLYSPKTDAIYHPDALLPDRPITSSIIVPAYHERDNLAPLVYAVFAAVRDPAATEILIVDDNSRDGTIEECARLRKEEGYNVELLVRTDEKGLSSAVLRGFERARGSKMVVMDADLQVRSFLCFLETSSGDRFSSPLSAPSLCHSTSLRLPHSRYPSLLRYSLRRRRFDVGRLASPPSDHFLGSEAACSSFDECKRPDDWVLCRHEGARTSNSPPVYFPLLTPLSLQLQTAQPINPSGFKIALEVLLKAPSPTGTYPEVAYSFGVRTVGASKLGAKVMLKYVGQLLSLYVWAFGIWFHLFVAVAVTLGVRIVDKLWHERQRILTRDKQYPLGGFHPDGGVPPLSPKAIGKNKPSLTNRGGGGGGHGAGAIGLQSLTGGASGWGGAGTKEKKRFV